ncbi:MAG: cytidyltransferase, partial [Chlamydiae bacterium]|nr:cytidyltransferase [Chlamydiota bacterium]
KRADFISLNEPELRLAAHDRYGELEEISKKILEKMQASSLSVTRGVNGALCLSKDSHEKIPAMVSRSVDRLGAGDSYLTLASLCAVKKYPLDLIGFIGSVAAAIDVQIVGNRDSIKKDALCKFITRLYK